jgi:hypothetical protein
MSSRPIADGHLRKIIIFTEHRDTLNYLVGRIQELLGRREAVVSIRGEVRRATQTHFTTDKDVQVLVATDAAGEGLNLQRAHLMVNYDLPWNPNRIEQRFGRIHRIGQTEVCQPVTLLGGNQPAVRVRAGPPSLATGRPRPRFPAPAPAQHAGTAPVRADHVRGLPADLRWVHLEPPGRDALPGQRG